MISVIEPEEEEDNKTTQQQTKKRILYCIGCEDGKEADYIVGKKNLPLCQKHWEIYAALVLVRRSVDEEERLV